MSMSKNGDNFLKRGHRSVGLKGNTEYTKKGITSTMECADVAAFTFAT